MRKYDDDGPRPEGTDGSDHSFRMIIEDKYKRIAILKKYNRITFIFQFILMLVSGLWNSIPTFLIEYPFPNIVAWLLVGEFIAVLCFYFGKMGTPKERIFFLKLYCLSIALLAVEHTLTRYMYHVKTPKEYLFPVMISKFIIKNNFGNLDFVKNALTVFEAFMDTSLLFVLISAILLSHSYIQNKRIDKLHDKAEKNKDVKAD